MTAPQTRYVLAVRRTAPDGEPLVAVEVLAREAGLHPDLLLRLIALGALQPGGGTVGGPLFRRDAAAQLSRIVRLRRDLGLNYAGAILAGELMARIEELEHRLGSGQTRIDAQPRR